MKLPVLYLLLAPVIATAYVSDSGPTAMQGRELASLSEESFTQKKSCLRSLVSAPTTPVFARMYFQTFNGEEVLALRCRMGDQKESARFLFLTKDGPKSLRLPLTSYRVPTSDGSYEEINLPGKVIRIREHQVDYYLRPEFDDMVHIHSEKDLSSIAAKLMTDSIKLRRKYLTVYERFLRERQQSELLELRRSSDAEVSYLRPCLEKKQQALLEAYLKNRKQVENETFQMIADEFQQTHSACMGVISPEQLRESIERVGVAKSSR